MARDRYNQNNTSTSDKVDEPVLEPEIKDTTEENVIVDPLTTESNVVNSTEPELEINSVDELPKEDETTPSDLGTDDNHEDLIQKEETTEEVKVLITLADAIEISKNNTVEETINILYTGAVLDIKIFAAELRDIITAYSKKSELESNNGNRKLYSLLQRVLTVSEGSEFKFKFDIVNRLFKDVDYFQPVTLLNCTKWSRSEKELGNFAQLITIIEDLADRATRNENKKRITNLSNLTLDEKALENIKNYYKL